MNNKAYSVPLHEQLAHVPREARLVIEDADGMGTSYIPVGKICHEAAAELRRLHEVNAELVEALRRMKLEKGFVCDCGIEDATWDLIEAIQEKTDGSH